MVKRVVFGEVANKQVAGLSDLNRREFFVLGILALAVLLLGVWPAPLVEMMSVSVQQLVEQLGHSKLAALQGG
jgi:NADH-quinone oxidoreductase subunit M